MSVISISRSFGRSGRDASGVLDRLDDVLVAGAPADIAFEVLADLGLGGLRVVGQQGNGRHHHAGGAEAALQAMALAKRRLDGMELVAFGQAFDRGDRAAIDLEGEYRAGFDRAAVDMDGAGAALGGVATLVGTGQAELLAQ